MAELDTNSTSNERIVAVFPDEAAAERAAAEARNRGGRNVAVNDPNDDVKALMGEMREETSESWAGPVTPEMARHIPGPTAGFALAGALLAVPVAFLDFGVGRVILCAFSGAVAGGLIGFLLGGFIGARRRANLD
ncbi:MAG TPA: hypothetical protein VFW57_02430, partial [Acidimicrobiia bacterium]|nr:hypothetical protein [Acidimicrobiia bacterium]